MAVSHFLPSFLSLSHARHHQNNGFLAPTALLLRGDCYTPPSEFEVIPLNSDVKVPFFHYINAPNIKIIQSCNGLLICGSLVDNIFVDRFSRFSRYFICNPTTKKFKMLSFPVNPPKDFQFAVNLAFDPLKSPHYKMICIRELSRECIKFELVMHYKFELDFYSSETDSWSISRTSFDVTGTIEFQDAVFYNGRIYWYGYGNESLYFDVENECLQTLPMPIPTMNEIENGRYFGESRGNLYLAVTYYIPIWLEFDVFVMASDFSGWYLKNHLCIVDTEKLFPELKFSCIEFCPGFSGMCFIQSEKEDKGCGLGRW